MRGFIFCAVLGVLLLQQAEIGSLLSTEEYEDECSDAINYEKGTLVSPRYRNYYKPDENCTWNIRAPPGLTISLRFKTFDLEGSDTCSYDYVTVYDIPDFLSLGTFCYDNVPDLITSSGNQMRVRFKTDSSVQRRGFSATFSTSNGSIAGSSEAQNDQLPVVSTGIPSQDFSPCGGYIQDANGTVQSPNYPLQYEPLQHCAWTIEAPEDSRIYLKFDIVDLEYGADCQFDQVIVLDGDDAESPTIGKICGDDQGRRLLSSKNKITVKFTSDDTFEQTGFNGTFGKVLNCGGNITAENGVLQSPNGTGGYACTWRITVPENNTVVLKVRADPMSYNPERYFEMTIRDGPYLDSNFLGQYPYLDDNFKVRSSRNQMLITATSYGSEELPQLYAEFEQYSCGGDLSGDAGAFMSPNYPDIYSPNEDCTWKITVPENYQVHLTFQTFRIEYSSSCDFDFVEIREGHSPSGPVLRRFCGDDRPILPRFETNKISVRFVSDSSRQDQGFTAQFEKDSFHTDYTDTCNRYITSESGNITSPSYPSFYPGNSHCIWKLRVPEANSVVLKFNAFNLEASETCQYDYVKVFDGHDNLNSRLLGTYCGTSIPEAIHSTTDRITVVFVSDSSVPATGFSAEFFGVSYSELEDLLRKLPNVISEQAKVKAKPSSRRQKKLSVTKRSLVQSLRKTFKLM